LDGVGCPAVGEGCDDGDRVCYRGIVVDLGDGVDFQRFEPKIHVTTDVFAADEEAGSISTCRQT